jgi:hypothetical protein
MGFSGDGEANGVHSANQTAPIRIRWDAVLLGDFSGAGLIDIANTGELRAPFLGERSVNARVLFAKMADADDCGAKCQDCNVSRF